MIGQWQVISPDGQPPESQAYVGGWRLVRYASYERWLATRPRVSATVRGNGPDWQKMIEAVSLRRSLSQETSVQFLQGYLYDSPPVFLPGLGERYRLGN